MSTSVELMPPTRGTREPRRTITRCTSEEERWKSRPIFSATVRLLASAIPILMSTLAAYGVSRALPHPGGTLGLLWWWGAMLTCSTVVLVAVDRLARRLLPLATLLKLSLAFPDRAPDRFWVAFRAGTVRDLQQRLASAREHGLRDEPAEAAAQIITLVGSLTTHDRRTRGHCERVRAFNDLLAEEMRLSAPDRDRLRWAALLHDIGKLHTSPAILNKPERPSNDEWEVIRRHPEEGARIIAPLWGWLGSWAVTVEQHHERWDGTGYPSGLAGEGISLGARIVAVADAFEVMTAPRPYRRPVSAHAAREELAQLAGRDFDPAVVRAFLNISLGKLRKIIGPISWLAQLPILGSFPRLPAAAGHFGRQTLTSVGAVTGVAVLSASSAIQPLLPGTTQSFAEESGRPAASGADLSRVADSVNRRAGLRSPLRARSAEATHVSPVAVLGHTLSRPLPVLPAVAVPALPGAGTAPEIPPPTLPEPPPAKTPSDHAPPSPRPASPRVPAPPAVAPSPPAPGPASQEASSTPTRRGHLPKPPPPRGRALGHARATVVGRRAGNPPPRSDRVKAGNGPTRSRSAVRR